MPKPQVELVPSDVDANRFLELLVALDTHHVVAGTLFEPDEPIPHPERELGAYIGKVMAVTCLDKGSARAEQSVFSYRHDIFHHERYASTAFGALEAYREFNRAQLILIDRQPRRFRPRVVQYRVENLVSEATLQPQISVEFFEPAR